MTKAKQVSHLKERQMYHAFQRSDLQGREIAAPAVPHRTSEVKTCKNHNKVRASMQNFIFELLGSTPGFGRVFEHLFIFMSSFKIAV